MRARSDLVFASAGAGKGRQKTLPAPYSTIRAKCACSVAPAASVPIKDEFVARWFEQGRKAAANPIEPDAPMARWATKVRLGACSTPRRDQRCAKLVPAASRDWSQADLYEPPIRQVDHQHTISREESRTGAVVIDFDLRTRAEHG